MDCAVLRVGFGSPVLPARLDFKNSSPACIMWVQTAWARPCSLRNVAASAVFRFLPSSLANCSTCATVISAVTFSRQHFFFRSIISASRQNGFAYASRNKPEPAGRRWQSSLATVTSVTCGRLARNLHLFPRSSNSEVFRHLQGRAAHAADYGRAVSAGERIVHYAGTGWTVKNGMRFAVCRRLRDLSHKFP